MLDVSHLIKSRIRVSILMTNQIVKKSQQNPNKNVIRRQLIATKGLGNARQGTAYQICLFSLFVWQEA